MLNTITNTLHDTSFDLLNVNQQKSKIAYVTTTGYLLEHIIITNYLSSLEKLFFTLANSLAIISFRTGKQRSVALSAENWAEKLNCSKTQVFTLQKSLSDKGYFIITKDKNKHGQNKRNLIFPTLPDSVFNELCKAPNRAGEEQLNYVPTCETKLEYLDRTKLFINLNYQLLKTICAAKDLSAFHKIIWLDFYCWSYKNSFNQDKNNGLGYNLIASYQELAVKHSCTVSVISKAMISLEKWGFIKRRQLYIRKENSIHDRQDKSLWQISLLLPTQGCEESSPLENYTDCFTKPIKDEEEIKARTQLTTSNIDLPTSRGSNQPITNRYNLLEEKASNEDLAPNISTTDPDFVKFDLYINKDFKIKNIDRIDNRTQSKKKKVRQSALSEFSQNFIEEKPKSLNLHLTIVSNLRDWLREEYNEFFNQLKSMETARTPTTGTNRTMNGTLKHIEKRIETNQQSNFNLKPKVQLQSEHLTKTEEKDKTIANKILSKASLCIELAATNSLENSGGSSPRSLKDFYPLTKEMVNILNRKSGREFSVNFANELLLKLAARYPSHTFLSTNQMVVYMTKAFLYEKHQGPMVNHETFRFAKKDEEGREAWQKEQYLAKVENDLGNSSMSQLRRKIAVSFEANLAYRLLTECKFMLEDSNTFQVKLPHSLSLREDKKQALTKEIKLIYGSNIEVKYKIMQGRVEGLHQGCKTTQNELNLGDRRLQKDKLKHGLEQGQYQDPELDKIWNHSPHLYQQESASKDLWYKVRQELKDQYGAAVDRAWFSKLKVEEDKITRKLTVKAPTNFIRDWIKCHYGQSIEQCFKKFSEQLAVSYSVT